MTASSINVAPDIAGETIPQTVRPVAVETIGSVDVQKFLQVDGSGVTLTPGKALGTLGNGQKTVASAGTAEALAASTTCVSITMKALLTNTGSVYVGDSSVDSSNGFILAAGDALALDISDLATIYLDADVNGEGVSFIYLV